MSAKAGIGMLSVKRTDFPATQAKIGGLKVYGHQRGHIESRVPDVPALKLHSNPVVNTSLPTDQSKDQKDIKDDARDCPLLLSLNGPGTVDSVIEGARKIKDPVVKMNIAIKLLESKASPLTYTARQQNKKNRRKADRVYEKLFTLLCETQKVAFNLHQMLAEIKQNEWNLTEFEYNHLFHEIRDGSWTYDKVLDETLEPKEDFRRHVIIFDVYCKVLLDNLFKDCQFLLQSLVEEKKSHFISEFETLRKNTICLRTQYDYLQVRGHIPYVSKPFVVWGARIMLPPTGATVVCNSSNDCGMVEEMITGKIPIILEPRRGPHSSQVDQASYHPYDNWGDKTGFGNLFAIRRPELCVCPPEEESDEEEISEQTPTDADAECDDIYFSDIDEVSEDIAQIQL